MHQLELKCNFASASHHFSKANANYAVLSRCCVVTLVRIAEHDQLVLMMLERRVPKASSDQKQLTVKCYRE